MEVLFTAAYKYRGDAWCHSHAIPADIYASGLVVW
jgi:hypothetical protein